MSKPMSPNDPAYWMLSDDFTSTPVTYNDSCYICNDREFAQMGLPLCYKCLICEAHVPADDHICDNGHLQPTDPVEEVMIRKAHNLEITQELSDMVKQLEESNG
jgi:hypothetical protein